MIIVQGYSQESGRIFIKNFPPEEFKAATQNWNIVQDRCGLMYFSNAEGLLEYDGVNWKLFKLPGLHEILMGTDGLIYAALENDFGVFKQDDSGNLRYHSFKDRIPGGSRDLSTVWQLHSQGKKIIFRSNNEIFILENDSIKIIKPETYFSISASIGDTLFVRQPGKGLYSLENDSLVLVDGGEVFVNERINVVIPFGEKDLLVAVRNKGIYAYSISEKKELYKSEKFREIDQFLIENPAYCGIALPGGDFAFGTITKGIIIFNREGRIKKLINKNSGLLDNAVYGLLTDRRGQLWAALDNGISLIQYNLPLTFYNEQNGLNGNILCLQYYQNHLYAGTSQYLFYQNETGDFEIVQGSAGQNFDLFESKGILLSARNPGMLTIKGRKAYLIPGTYNIAFLVIIALNDYPDYLIAGSGAGLFLFKYHTSSWQLDHKIRGFDMPVYGAVIDKDLTIWASSIIGLYKLQISQDLDSITSSKQYTTADGLPASGAYPSKLLSGEVVFGTEKGIYKYLWERDVFVPNPDFSMLKGSVSSIIQINNNDIWFEELKENRTYEKGILQLREGKYYPYKTPFYKLSSTSFSDICLSPDSSINIGTFSGLLKYNPNAGTAEEYHFSTLIRKVFSRDSLLYGGESTDSAGFLDITGHDVRFRDNDMVFHFAATFYEDAEKNLYSFRLSGQDTAWSHWASDTKKEYTNLHEGRYVFQVKSMNQYKETGSTASYSFRIMPPWYRTWWAFALYGIISVFAVWIIVKLNVLRLEKQKDQLEETVAERTAQLKSTLKVVNSQKLELKSTLEVVNSQKLEIESAHEQITDSIKYARYIQTAILPQKELLEAYLKEYFVFYMPKDIVSGDFYWVTQLEDLTVIAAGDCTGHGVPGAFMSMLGAAFLNEIVNKEKITHPGVILNRLRKEVIRSLHQHGETGELRDGMDLAVCVIDFNQKTLQFAGANNPIYIIRKKEDKRVDCDNTFDYGDYNLFEMKGDHMPIAIHESMTDFNTHEIELVRGDMLYMFSDGFADQFGGSEGKKLHYKAFRKILLEYADEAMGEQKRYLEKAFSEWKGGYAQVDDVLVVGFRV